MLLLHALLLLPGGRLVFFPGDQTIGIDEADAEEAEEVAEKYAPSRDELEKARRVGQEPRCVGGEVEYR